MVSLLLINVSNLIFLILPYPRFILPLSAEEGWSMLTCCRLSLSWSSPSSSITIFVFVFYHHLCFFFSWSSPSSSITIFYLSDQVDIHKFPMLSLHHHSYYINLIYQTKFAVLAILSAFPSRINKFGQHVIVACDSVAFALSAIPTRVRTANAVNCKKSDLPTSSRSSCIFSIHPNLLDPSECTMRKVQVIPMQHLQSSVICLPTSHPINLLLEN